MQGLPPRLLAVSDKCPPAMHRSAWSIKDFVLVKEVGSGAASTVYFALDRRSTLSCAIKVYLKDKLSRLNRKQVEREITIHSSLSHPHIVEFYAAFEDAERIYMVQEYAAGGDLFDDVKRRGGRLSEAEVVQSVLYPYLCALMYLHRRGIIHRDIKPENTVFSRERVMKVTDFGLAVDTRLERPVTRLGTLDYMSPEVLRCPDKFAPEDNKERVDLAYSAAVDSWAMGVLAYELIVGRPPFGMSCREDTMRAIAVANPSFPDWMSPGATDFIQCALQRSPGHRASAQQLISHRWVVSHMRGKLGLGQASYEATLAAPTTYVPSEAPTLSSLLNGAHVAGTHAAGPQQQQRLYDGGILYPDDLHLATAKRAVQRCASALQGRTGHMPGQHSLNGVMPGNVGSQMSGGPKPHDTSYWITNGAGFSHDRLAGLGMGGVQTAMQGVQGPGTVMPMEQQRMQPSQVLPGVQQSSQAPIMSGSSMGMAGPASFSAPAGMLPSMSPPLFQPSHAQAPEPTMVGPYASVFPTAAVNTHGSSGPLTENGPLPAGLTAADYYQAQPGAVQASHKTLARSLSLSERHVKRRTPDVCDWEQHDAPSSSAQQQQQHHGGAAPLLPLARLPHAHGPQDPVRRTPSRLAKVKRTDSITDRSAQVQLPPPLDRQCMGSEHGASPTTSQTGTPRGSVLSWQAAQGARPSAAAAALHKLTLASHSSGELLQPQRLQTCDSVGAYTHSQQVPCSSAQHSAFPPPPRLQLAMSRQGSGSAAMQGPSESAAYSYGPGQSHSGAASSMPAAPASSSGGASVSASVSVSVTGGHLGPHATCMDASPPGLVLLPPQQQMLHSQAGVCGPVASHAINSPFAASPYTSPGASPAARMQAGPGASGLSPNFDTMLHAMDTEGTGGMRQHGPMGHGLDASSFQMPNGPCSMSGLRMPYSQASAGYGSRKQLRPSAAGIGPSPLRNRSAMPCAQSTSAAPAAPPPDCAWLSAYNPMSAHAGRANAQASSADGSSSVPVGMLPSNGSGIAQAQPACNALQEGGSYSHLLQPPAAAAAALLGHQPSGHAAACVLEEAMACIDNGACDATLLMLAQERLQDDVAGTSLAGPPTHAHTVSGLLLMPPSTSSISGSLKDSSCRDPLRLPCALSATGLLPLPSHSPAGAPAHMGLQAAAAAHVTTGEEQYSQGAILCKSDAGVSNGASPVYRAGCGKPSLELLPMASGMAPGAMTEAGQGCGSRPVSASGSASVSASASGALTLTRDGSAVLARAGPGSGNSMVLLRSGMLGETGGGKGVAARQGLGSMSGLPPSGSHSQHVHDALSVSMSSGSMLGVHGGHGFDSANNIMLNSAPALLQAMAGTAVPSVRLHRTGAAGVKSMTLQMLQPAASCQLGRVLGLPGQHVHPPMLGSCRMLRMGSRAGTDAHGNEHPTMLAAVPLAMGNMRSHSGQSQTLSGRSLSQALSAQGVTLVSAGNSRGASSSGAAALDALMRGGPSSRSLSQQQLPGGLQGISPASSQQLRGGMSGTSVAGSQELPDMLMLPALGLSIGATVTVGRNSRSALQAEGQGPYQQQLGDEDEEGVQLMTAPVISMGPSPAHSARSLHSLHSQSHSQSVLLRLPSSNGLKQIPGMDGLDDQCMDEDMLRDALEAEEAAAGFDLPAMGIDIGVGLGLQAIDEDDFDAAADSSLAADFFLGFSQHKWANSHGKAGRQ